MTDGCVHFLYNSSLKFHLIGKCRRYGPFIIYKISPARSPSSSKTSGPPCWASSLAFGLIGLNFRLSSRLQYILPMSPLSTFPQYHSPEPAYCPAVTSSDDSLVKKKTKLSSYIRKFNWDQVQSHR
jgi:hypothetical protein